MFAPALFWRGLRLWSSPSRWSCTGVFLFCENFVNAFKTSFINTRELVFVALHTIEFMARNIMAYNGFSMVAVGAVEGKKILVTDCNGGIYLIQQDEIGLEAGTVIYWKDIPGGELAVKLNDEEIEFTKKHSELILLANKTVGEEFLTYGTNTQDPEMESFLKKNWPHICS